MAQRLLPIILHSRLRFVLAMCLLLTLPFLVARLPPLTDLPGHMGSSAVAAYADDAVFTRFMRFRWHLVPNLGTDLVVAALQGRLGLACSYRLVAAVIPALLAAGLLMIARILNPRGAAASSWALLFVYSFPLNTGFLNYMLGVALVLIGFALWMRLDRHPGWREAAGWIVIPLVFLCHVVAGCLLVLFIGTREFERAWRGGGLRRLPARIRPLLSSVVILVLWRLDAQSFAGRNHASVTAKLDAVVMLLRDQNLLLDCGSLALALAVFVAGWRAGARPSRAVAPALLLLIALFVVIPSSLSGSSYADERLLPVLAMVAFATQDYSRAPPLLARLVAVSGLALLVLRTGVTTAGFAAYDGRYRTQLQALRFIPEHSRVLVLNMRDCDPLHHWRGDRLDHLGELAIVDRRSWTNSEWDVDGAHLLQILYRPSPRFYDDPSQYVWPASCGGIPKRRPTMQDAVSAIPFDGIDALWLIDVALPPGYRNPRLSLRWHAGRSTLYAVRPRSRISEAPPPTASKEQQPSLALPVLRPLEK